MRGRRKRSSWGSVERLPSGRWRVRWWESTPDGWRRRSETIDGTRKDAERRLAQIRVARDDAPRVPTVGEAWERWVWPLIKRGRASTASTHDSTWRNHVAPRWKDVPLDQVEPMAVQDWLDGLRASAGRNGLTLLRRIVHRAVAMGAVQGCRIDIEFVMPTESKSHDKEIWTSQELSRLCEAARATPFEAAVILAAYGGCRRGEALGVKVGEVVPGVGGTACVQVVRSINLSGEVGPTKTKSSMRTVVVPPPWGGRLLEIQTEALGRGDAWLCDDGMGGPLPASVVRHGWPGVVQAAGVELRPFRNLRPSFETMAHWEAGMGVEQVQKLMGHAKPTMTYQVYDRPSQDALTDAVAEAFGA